MFKDEKEFKNIVNKLDIDTKSNSAHREKLKKQLLSVFEESPQKQNTRTIFILKYIRNTIMKSPIIKLAAAAVIIIAVGIFLYTTNTMIPAAYALQDTIDAYSSVSSLCMKMIKLAYGQEPYEIWLECDSYGNITRIRCYSPNHGLGSSTIVESNGKSEAWLPEQNVQLIGYRNLGVALTLDISQVDPKGLVENLYKQELLGEVILDVNQPVQKDKPILITVTYPEGSLSENWKKILYIDQGTKLVKKIEKLEFRDEQYQLMETRELFDYNQPIDSAMFSLEGEIPADATVLDMTGVDVGLLQGDMTEEEAANEITRQFFKAAIAKDSTRLGRLFIIGPAYLTEQTFVGIDSIEITSIEPARPETDPDEKGFLCSGKIRYESGDLFYETNVFELFIRQTNPVSEPNRWMITGISLNTYPFPDDTFQGFFGFENGLTGWSSLKGSVSMSSDSYSGSKACQIEGRESEGSANSPYFHVTAGQAYELKSYVKLLNGTGDCKVMITWLNKVGFPVRYDNGWAGGNRPMSYVLHGGTFVAPEDAVLCTIMLGVQPGSTYLFDDIEFIPSLEE